MMHSIHLLEVLDRLVGSLELYKIHQFDVPVKAFHSNNYSFNGKHPGILYRIF